MADAKIVPLEQQVYDENGKLTLDGMQKLLAADQSVLHNMSVLTHPSHLPNEAQMAKGDATKEAAARENLMRQRADIEAQIASIGQSERAHQSQQPVISVPAHPDGSAGLGTGGYGEGDTAGADGDKGDPNSPAGKKAAQEEADAKKAADDAKKAAGVK